MSKKEKNNQKKEFKGRNLEDVISHAEHVLKIPRSKFNYEIVAEKTKLFGIKTKEIVIRAWPKTQEEGQPTNEFLDKLLSYLPLDIKYKIKKNNKIKYFIFEGPDKRFLLQKDGALLLALQHILNKVSSEKIQTDCDYYKQKKEKELKDYVHQVARKVKKSGRNEILDPMNPYKRRLVHITVNQIPGLSTESLGNGFMKKIKVYQKKK
ncbi:MAG: protein jag [Acidobacteriota bacterium]